MKTGDILLKVSKIDREIEDLRERLVLKQRERDEVISSAQAVLTSLKPPKAGHYNGARRGVPKGTPNLLHRKFTPEQIREIRTRWAAGESQGELGREYGAPQPTISNIVHRKTYQDIPDKAPRKRTRAS